MSFNEVQLAEQHFKSAHSTAEASQNLIADVQNILKSSNGNLSSAQSDMTKLNQELNLKEQGFPDGFQILGATGNDLVLSDKKDQSHLLVFDNTGTQKFDGKAADALDYVQKANTATSSNVESAAAVKDDGQQSATTDGAQPRDYQINKGDSLWKIAKGELPDGASPREVLDYVHKIEALNPDMANPDQIKAGETIKLPPQAGKDDGTGDGTGDGNGQPKADTSTEPKVTTDDQGNKVTTWNDGTERHENADGTGYVKKPDNSEQHWGPKAEDNYDKTPNGDKLPVTYTDDGGRTEHLPNNSTLTTWDDGTRRRDNPDGSGFVQHPDKSEQHWGPKPEDNYEVTSQGEKITVSYNNDDHSTTKTDQSGNAVTTWPDGVERHQNADGTVGYVKNADGSEHHWGPQSDQNYDITSDGGRQTTDADGNKITMWQDGTIRYDNADNSGKVLQPQPDGSYKVHHWGPNADQNYDDSEAAPGKKAA